MADNNKSRSELLEEISELQKQIGELEKAGAQNPDTPDKQTNQEQIFLRTIIDNLPDLIYVKDKNARKIISNRVDTESMGCKSEEEVLGKTDFDFYPEKIAQNFFADDKKVMETGKSIINREEILADKDDKKCWLLTSKLPLKDKDGNIIGLIGIGRDITDRKLAEETLEHERNFLKTLINNLPDAIYAKDTEGRKTIANLADIWNLGHSKIEDVLGKTDFDFFPQEIAENFFANDMAIVRSGEPLLNKEEFFIDREGKKHWLLTSKLPLKDNNGNITGLIGIGRDITDQKIAEEALKKAYKELENTNEELKKANRVKGEFLANMSHEIRTPLNAIVGMTELLLKTPLNDEQREYSETILNSGDILLSLINDILDFSKIEAQKIELEKQPFDIRVCIEEALDLVAGKAEEKNLELAYSMSKGLPEKVIGDVTRLRQILVNLLSNSIKFTEKGEVIVSVSGQVLDNNSYKLLFSVRDTGIGIRPEMQDTLFRSFSQIDASTTRKFGGTGLGLAISKQLSELMGGTMWAESSGVKGEGSTFYFTFVTESFNGEGVIYDLPDLSGKRTLIVDDNATNRQILLQQTQQLKMTAKLTASGSEALELIEQGEEFDLAILDYHMPGMDGITLAEKIHKILKEETPPLILLSSYSYRESKHHVSLFAATLTKPIKLSSLNDALRTILIKKEIVTKKYEPAPPQVDIKLGKENPLQILLAEDNKINQKVALRSLEKMGYRADTAFNGIEVLDALKLKSYDVILMDVQMPEMDGEQATIEIRKQYPSDQLRIIAVTANAIKTDLDRYLSIGMNGYLVKPFKMNELAQLLKESFEIKKSKN